MRWARSPILKRSVFHRRARNDAVTQSINPPIIKSFMNNSIRRARWLLTSLDQLELEASDNIPIQHQLDKDLPQWMLQRREWSDLVMLRKTFIQAFNAKAPMTDLTEEFLEARGESYNSEKEDFYMFLWALYRENCRKRHRWGELSRSNLDWDWDPSDAMSLLFTNVDTEKSENDNGMESSL